MKKVLIFMIACLSSVVCTTQGQTPCPWHPNTGVGENTMIVRAIVQIDGVEMFDEDLIVGAFYGEECRGVANVLTQYYNSLHHYFSTITLYGLNGDVLSFRLWDKETGQELQLTPPATITFVGNGNLGSWSNPHVLNFTTPTQAFEYPIVGYGSNTGGYYLIASPVTVAPADVAGDPQGMTAGNFDLYYFDNSKEDEWINYKNEDGTVNTNFGNITPGKGYLYAREESTELQFSGELYDGDGQFNLAYSTGNPSADMRGWNLVGNPFTYGASVDKDAFYVMNEEGRNDIIVSGETAIAPMQGIFVLATAEGQTVKFTRALQPLDGKVVLNLNRNRGTVIDRAIVRLGEGGTLPKFMLNPENTKIYIEQGGDDYAMVSSNEDEIPVSFKAASNGTYTLNVAVQNAELDYLHLIDNLAGTDTDLLANPNYTFEANTGDYASRFTLVLRNTTGLVEHFAFFNGHNWTVSNQGEATLQVIDVTGRLVSTKTIDGTTQLDINAAPGVYMFRLVNGSDVKVQKVIVR